MQNRICAIYNRAATRSLRRVSTTKTNLIRFAGYIRLQKVSCVQHGTSKRDEGRCGEVVHCRPTNFGPSQWKHAKKPLWANKHQEVHLGYTISPPFLPPPPGALSQSLLLPPNSFHIDNCRAPRRTKLQQLSVIPLLPSGTRQPPSLRHRRPADLAPSRQAMQHPPDHNRHGVSLTQTSACYSTAPLRVS